jgi:hypothetical protein
VFSKNDSPFWRTLVLLKPRFSLITWLQKFFKIASGQTSPVIPHLATRKPLQAKNGVVNLVHGVRWDDTCQAVVNKKNLQGCAANGEFRQSGSILHTSHVSSSPAFRVLSGWTAACNASNSWWEDPSSLYP